MAASASSWIDRPITGAVSPTSSRTPARWASGSSSWSSPRLTNTITGLEVSNCSALSSASVSSPRPARHTGVPAPSTSIAASIAATSGASTGLDRAALRRLSMCFSIASRSAVISSSSRISSCSAGSEEPGTSVSSKARSTNTVASTSRMWARKRLPSPSPWEAPFTRPAMSTNCTAVGMTFLDLLISASASRRLSSTLATPTLGSTVAKA